MSETIESALISSGVLEIPQKPISSWKDFESVVSEREGWKGWLFRGQSDWSWYPESTLRRESARQQTNDIVRRELGLIRRFRREYAQYSSDMPADDDYLQWMAIMRHHGAPTRLIDITYSIYVALYFATIDVQQEHEASIWCFNIQWLIEAYNAIAPRKYRAALKNDKTGNYIDLYKVILNDRSPKIYISNPNEMPARMTRQQGGFLLPTDITTSFMENLSKMNAIPGITPSIVKLKLQLSPIALKEVFNYLQRLNISSTTLFPGLDGFANSLRMLMSTPEQTYTYTDRFD